MLWITFYRFRPDFLPHPFPLSFSPTFISLFFLLVQSLLYRDFLFSKKASINDACIRTNQTVSLSQFQSQSFTTFSRSARLLFGTVIYIQYEFDSSKNPFHWLSFLRVEASKSVNG